ncbi:MAG: endo-1,4-beta-xylanase [Anaerolineae bacterium]|nr:endo-1,4-beta-xylanase [Anaerolineae bacterium]
MSLKGSFKRSANSLFSMLFLAFITGLMLVSCGPAKGTVSLEPTTEATAPPVEKTTEPASETASIVYDFEDGTTQGWKPRADEGSTVSVDVATDVAHSGSNSLLTTKREENWNGATVDVMNLLKPDTTYEFSAFVKLADGAPASRLVLTMQRTPTDGDSKYEWIAPSAEDGVTDADWVELKGKYSYAGEVAELMLYVESPDEELVDFYVDDVTITMIGTATAGANVYDFEDGTEQGWKPRGDAKLSVATDVAHSGSNSLLVSDRKADWNGPTIDVMTMLQPDITYDISGFVKLADGEPNSRVIITMQRTPTDGDTQYEWIAPSAEDGVTDAEWVELKGQYTYSGEVTELMLYVESPDEELVDFYIDDITISGLSKPPVQTDILSLYEMFTDDFLVGAALPSEQLDSEDHVTLLTHHFNSVTAENEMKPGPIQPEEGEFNWTGPDKLVAFAGENNIAVHGHTLVWHSQAAEWMFEDADGNPLEATPENKELVLKRMEEHIRAVVGRYKDDVNVWDVVNEVIDPAEDDCMRRSKWYELTGTDYIAAAFRIADEVAPDAVLIINDYSTTDQLKRQCLYNVVKDLKAQGVPVDGVGHQMHVNIDTPTAAAIEETILMFADLDVEQHITELDMSVYPNDTDTYDKVPEDVLVKQGYRYKEIFEVLKRQADNIDSVTFWGMADDHTWLKTFPIARTNLPLLFDEQLQAKPAYWGIVDPSRLPVLIQQLEAPEGTPAIDGEIEDLWNTQAWSTLQGTETLTGTFQTLWDKDNLYLFVDIKDATPDPADKIDIFIDQDNGKTDTYGDDDLQITCQDGACAPSDDIEFSMKTTAGGYQLEAAFKPAAAPELGRQIGFDIRVTDSAQPDGIISWNDTSHSQETSTAGFGTLTFVEAVAITFALPGTPVIDAEEDPVWTTANEITTDVWVMGDSGSTAKVKTLWDSQYLYVYAVVTDSLLTKVSANVWEQDSIEVFVDQNNAKTDTYQPDDGQYRVNFDNEQSFNGGATAEKIKSATKIIDGGYIVELSIRLDAITPAEGLRIGFDFQVNNDEDNDGVRDSVAMWHDPTGQSYQNTSKLGLLQFVSKQ